MGGRIFASSTLMSRDAGGRQKQLTNQKIKTMIYYNVIKRKSPKDATVKFYAQSVTSSYLTLDQVAENISRESTVTIHDIKAVLSSLQEQVILALQDGKSVRFGDLGSFHVTIKSLGAESKDDFSKKNVSRLMVRFVRSSAMRSAFALTNKNVKLASREGSAAPSTSGGSGTGGNTGGDVNGNA